MVGAADAVMTVYPTPVSRFDDRRDGGAVSMYRDANPMKTGEKSLTSANSRAYSRAIAGDPAKGR